MAAAQRTHLRVEEFATQYGVSRRTVYHWIAWGWLPHERVAGSTRIPVAELQRILTEKPDNLHKLLTRIA